MGKTTIFQPELATIDEQGFQLMRSPFHGRTIRGFSIEGLARHYYGYFSRQIDALNERMKLLGESPRELVELQQSRDVYLRNYSANVFNHCFWFEQLTERKVEMPESLEALFRKHFGDFRATVREHAATNMGSGFLWVYARGSDVYMRMCPNALNPLWRDTPAPWQGSPLFCIDLWEHAWYMDYTSCDEYVNGILDDCTDWEVVTERAIEYGILQQPPRD